MIVHISPEEFEQRAEELLAKVGEDIFVIERDGRVLGALISPEEYLGVRTTRAEQAITAMRIVGERIQAVATPAEIRELESALDRKAS